MLNVRGLKHMLGLLPPFDKLRYVFLSFSQDIDSALSVETNCLSKVWILLKVTVASFVHRNSGVRKESHVTHDALLRGFDLWKAKPLAFD